MARSSQTKYSNHLTITNFEFQRELEGEARVFGGSDISPASVQVVVDADEADPGDYGQLLDVGHGTGRVRVPANCLQCSVEPMAEQVKGVLHTPTGDHWSPNKYSVMSSSCGYGNRSACQFTYMRTMTPVVTSIAAANTNATEGRRGTVVTVRGYRLTVGAAPTRRRRDNNISSESKELYINIGNAECVVDTGTWTGTSVNCVLGDVLAGQHRAVVIVPGHGGAKTSGIKFRTLIGVGGISPPAGSFGGMDSVTVSGFGFGEDKESVKVSLCGVDCKVTKASYGSVTCNTGRFDTVTSYLAYEDKEAVHINPKADRSVKVTGDRGAGRSFYAAFDQVYESAFSSRHRGHCHSGIDVGLGRRALVRRVRFFPVFTV